MASAWRRTTRRVRPSSVKSQVTVIVSTFNAARCNKQSADGTPRSFRWYRVARDSQGEALAHPSSTALR